MKRGSPMKRSAPMKQTGFARGIVATAQREPRDHTLSMQALVDSTLPRRAATYSGEASGEPVKKENASQSPSYMKAVRDLGYCMLCGKPCRPQFCHADEGKGTGIKSDCRLGWSGCAECHHDVGTARIYPKEARRALEAGLGLRTRMAVIAAGTWPARLKKWED